MKVPHSISSAACIIIGDEVLSGKIRDLNSHIFAKFCYDLGIRLQTVHVVPDNADRIVESIHQLRNKHDFIVTSGGIGPTHDDITYEAVAQSYGLKLSLDQTTVQRMHRIHGNKYHDNPQALAAQMRMATLPVGEIAHNHFVDDSLWVPIVSLDHRVYVLPGIPRLFGQLLNGLRPFIVSRLETQHFVRRYIKTSLGESAMAPVLTALQHEADPHEVKIGSYPHMDIKSNTVSVTGPEGESAYVEDVVARIAQALQGEVISEADEAKRSEQSEET